MTKYRLSPEGLGYIKMPLTALEILEKILPGVFKLGVEVEEYYDYYVSVNESDSENLVTGLLTSEEYIKEVEKLDSLLLGGEKIDCDSYKQYVSDVFYSRVMDAYEKLLAPAYEELETNLNKRTDKLSKYIYLTKLKEIIQEYTPTGGIREWLDLDLEFVVKWKVNHKEIVNLVQTNPFILDDFETVIEDAFSTFKYDIDVHIGELEGQPESTKKGLDLAERLLIVILLQNVGAFPKISPYQENKEFYSFLSGVMGEGDYKKKIPHAKKILSKINPTSAEAKRAIHSLRKIRPYLEGIAFQNEQISETLKRIDIRIKELSKLTPSD